MPQAPVCPKCQGSMERGYVPDQGHSNRLGIPAWIPGEPRAGFWKGLKAPEREVFMPLAAFRCNRCGFVEFYADGRYGAR